jgi:hypothetical protein
MSPAGLKYTYRPVYDSQNNGWVEYYNPDNNYGSIDGFLQSLNTEDPVKTFREKTDLKRSYRVATNDINNVTEKYFEPTLYMSINEGYCGDLFSNGQDVNKRAVGIESVRICVEYDKTLTCYFRHKSPRGNEATEKPH